MTAGVITHLSRRLDWAGCGCRAGRPGRTGRTGPSTRRCAGTAASPATGSGSSPCDVPDRESRFPIADGPSGQLMVWSHWPCRLNMSQYGNGHTLALMIVTFCRNCPVTSYASSGVESFKSITGCMPTLEWPSRSAACSVVKGTLGCPGCSRRAGSDLYSTANGGASDGREPR
jgi:hypothetical protein